LGVTRARGKRKGKCLMQMGKGGKSTRGRIPNIHKSATRGGKEGIPDRKGGRRDKAEETLLLHPCRGRRGKGGGIIKKEGGKKRKRGTNLLAPEPSKAPWGEKI